MVEVLPQACEFIIIRSMSSTHPAQSAQNYVADWVQSFTWGLVVGNASPIPYFYSVFFITVLVHRCGRDFERYVYCLYLRLDYMLIFYRCAKKYGKDWERYCAIVKYKFIPGIY